MAYIFCRVSRLGGGNSLSCSLNYQEAEIQQVTNNLRWRIKETIKYVGSAYKKTPEPLLNLCQLKRQKFIFYSVDRFSRNFCAGLTLAKKFVKNKNELYFTSENLKITATSNKTEWAAFYRYLTDAEAESLKIASRISDARKYLSSQGYFTGSVAPFGQKKVKLTNGRNILEIDPKSRYILQFIEGCRSPGMSLERLNQSMLECGGDTQTQPITLDDGSEEIETVLTYANIAQLLQDYYIEGGPWTNTKVSKIYKRYSIQHIASMLTSRLQLNGKRKLETIDGEDEEHNAEKCEEHEENVEHNEPDRRKRKPVSHSLHYPFQGSSPSLSKRGRFKS